MKTHHVWGPWLGALLLWAVTGTAQATLIGVLPTTPGGTDYQAYYDNVADLTWLADANAANGVMTWSAANTWAAGLDIGGVTDWRLPTTAQPDSTCGSQFDPGGGLPLQGFGINCTGSEMGNLFYNVLGGTAGTSISITHNSNYELFSNVQELFYWSATEFAPVTDRAWLFLFNGGTQGATEKPGNLFAWAVHAGNVAAASPGTTVPEPGTLWLMAAVLAGLAARRRLALRWFE